MYWNKSVLLDELAKLDGKPPYNEPSNPCWNDAYYAQSLLDKYGVDTMEELRKLAV